MEIHKLSETQSLSPAVPARSLTPPEKTEVLLSRPDQAVLSGIKAAPHSHSTQSKEVGIINDGPRMRARELGIKIGDYPTGKHNAITDIEGVKVGQVTHRSGSGPIVPGKGPVRTGVTAVIPSANNWNNKLMAGSYVMNGNGEMTGLTWLQESGYLEVPILLTNTLNVGKVSDGVVKYMVKHHPQVGLAQDVPIPVVGECDDSTLNDIQGRHVDQHDVVNALENAKSGRVEEGATGAGTGMVCYQFKGGIGTSSRVLPAKEGGYKVGVLVNTNMGDREDLMVDGVPVGKEIPEKALVRKNDGSIIVVIATDAPLSPGQLNRIAKRASLGLARTGSQGDMGSGDIMVAFSTANKVPREADGFTYPVHFLSDQFIDPLFKATEEATEEAILNSIMKAQTTEGPDGVIAHAIPLDRLKEAMKKYNHHLESKS